MSCWFANMGGVAAAGGWACRLLAVSTGVISCSGGSCGVATLGKADDWLRRLSSAWRFVVREPSCEAKW